LDNAQGFPILKHERLRQWVGASYDPELFSVQQVNSALAVLD
jgi:hypothetical protein